MFTYLAQSEESSFVHAIISPSFSVRLCSQFMGSASRRLFCYFSLYQTTYMPRRHNYLPIGKLNEQIISRRLNSELTWRELSIIRRKSKKNKWIVHEEKYFNIVIWNKQGMHLSNLVYLSNLLKNKSNSCSIPVANV